MTLSAVAQDWYHDREECFRGEGAVARFYACEDRSGTYLERRPGQRQRARASGEDERRAVENAGRSRSGSVGYGILNDVIDSVRKSSNDDRLAQRDRAVLADDVVRLKEFQDQHNRGR
jgi:hypothetical protein